VYINGIEMKTFVHKFVFVILFVRCYSFNLYLESLSIKNPLTQISLSHCTNVHNFANMKDAPLYPEKSVHIDSIHFNVYELKNIGFRPNTDTISFKMKNRLQHLYYVDEGKIFRLSDNTRIISECIRNFHVYEMDPDRNIDCIVFNSQKTTN
jgi:hypothetical protein